MNPALVALFGKIVQQAQEDPDAPIDISEIPAEMQPAISAAIKTARRAREQKASAINARERNAVVAKAVQELLGSAVGAMGEMLASPATPAQVEAAPEKAAQPAPEQATPEKASAVPARFDEFAEIVALARRLTDRAMSFAELAETLDRLNKAVNFAPWPPAAGRPATDQLSELLAALLDICVEHPPAWVLPVLRPLLERATVFLGGSAPSVVGTLLVQLNALAAGTKTRDEAGGACMKALFDTFVQSRGPK